MSDLITDVALAAEFGLELDRFHRLRREKGWPAVKIDRTTFRFTPEQRDQIIAMHTVSPLHTSSPAAADSGLTKGSKARGSAT